MNLYSPMFRRTNYSIYIKSKLPIMGKIGFEKLYEFVKCSNVSITTAMNDILRRYSFRNRI